MPGDRRTIDAVHRSLDSCRTSLNESNLISNDKSTTSNEYENFKSKNNSRHTVNWQNSDIVCLYV